MCITTCGNMCCSPESQLYPRLHQQLGDQQGMDGDSPPPLLLWGSTWSTSSSSDTPNTRSLWTRWSPSGDRLGELGMFRLEKRRFQEDFRDPSTAYRAPRELQSNFGQQAEVTTGQGGMAFH